MKEKLLALFLGTCMFALLPCMTAMADEADIDEPAVTQEVVSTDEGGTEQPADTDTPTEPEEPTEPEIPDEPVVQLTSPKLSSASDAATGFVRLSWNAVEGAAGYELYRAGSKNGEYKLLTKTDKLTYLDTNATVGVDYYYAVKAISAETEEANSELSNKTERVVDCARPVAATAMDAGRGKVMLRWSKVQGADKYYIYRAKGSGSFAKLDTVTATHYLSSSEESTESYTYYVVAVSNKSSYANSAKSNNVVIDPAKRVVAIAHGELEYYEKRSNYKLYTKNENIGEINYHKYGVDLKNAGYYGGSPKNGLAWCDQFVDWCFLQLTGDRRTSEYIECQTGGGGAACDFSMAYYKALGRFDMTPKVGDQVFFHGKGDPEPGHTAIVVAVDEYTFTTVEGNHGDKVYRGVHSLDSWKINGFGHPRYCTPECKKRRTLSA